VLAVYSLVDVQKQRKQCSNVILVEPRARLLSKPRQMLPFFDSCTFTKRKNVCFDDTTWYHIQLSPHMCIRPTKNLWPCDHAQLRLRAISFFSARSSRKRQEDSGCRRLSRRSAKIKVEVAKRECAVQGSKKANVTRVPPRNSRILSWCVVMPFKLANQCWLASLS
jgi:hypothetical protein